MTTESPTLERWLNKRELVEYLGCSIRSIQTALAEGMPHVVIYGRVKFRVPEVEAWLERNGHLVRRGDIADTRLDNEMARQRVTATGPQT